MLSAVTGGAGLRVQAALAQAGRDVARVAELGLDDLPVAPDADLAWLGELVGLSRLSLRRTGLVALTLLPPMPRLVEAALGRGDLPMQDRAAALRIHLLNFFSSNENALSDLAGLASFQALQCLTLSFNSIAFLQSLLQLDCLKNLRVLNIVGCPVSAAPNIHRVLFTLFPRLERIDSYAREKLYQATVPVPRGTQPTSSPTGAPSSNSNDEKRGVKRPRSPPRGNLRMHANPYAALRDPVIRRYVRPDSVEFSKTQAELIRNAVRNNGGAAATNGPTNGDVMQPQRPSKRRRLTEDMYANSPNEGGELEEEYGDAEEDASVEDVTSEENELAGLYADLGTDISDAQLRQYAALKRIEQENYALAMANRARGGSTKNNDKKRPRSISSSDAAQLPQTQFWKSGAASSGPRSPIIDPGSRHGDCTVHGDPAASNGEEESLLSDEEALSEFAGDEASGEVDEPIPKKRRIMNMHLTAQTAAIGAEEEDMSEDVSGSLAGEAASSDSSSSPLPSSSDSK